MTDLLHHKGYHASIHFSAADEVFYGKLLGINDLVTFEGTNVRELKKEFRNAVEDYLETCRTLGKEPEKHYKGSFNVRIPAALHRQAALVASGRQMTLNELVKAAINMVVNSGGKPGDDWQAA